MNEPVVTNLLRQYRPMTGNLASLLGRPRIRLALARLFYHLKVTGGNQIPAKGSCLVVFNHVSQIADTMVYLTVQHHRPDVTLFTWEYSQEVISGLIATHIRPGPWQSVFLTDIRPAYNVSELLRARQVLLDGGCIAIAPEGEATWDGRLQHPLSPGAAWLALQTGTPVLPIISKGGYDVQPLWRCKKIRLTGRISIQVGQPEVLSREPVIRATRADIQAATRRIWLAMADLTAG